MMKNWQRWLLAPQTHWLRKVLFQLHLWLGIGFGLYVLLISVSGSALLLKSPFYRWFEPKNIEPADVTPLQGDALTARMTEVYAGYELGFSFPSNQPGLANFIVLNKDGEYFPHYFNQYTGEDMGPANPWQIKTVEWLADIHDDLFMGRTGRKVNGIGGLLFILMSCSGLLIWWQGRARWYEGLIIHRGSRRGMLWQLHSFTGFWSLLLMLAWGISGFQLGFPGLFVVVERFFVGDPASFEPPGQLLRFLRGVHFARFGAGSWARWGWITASLLPGVMFVTGFILWWRRVVLKALSNHTRHGV